MPPTDKPRPDAKQSFAGVEWVGRELKRAEREARMSGGRVLSRRLNRSEYANTIRDLLHLDDNFAKLLEAELPGDGKAEGFDRIVTALLFDETQLATHTKRLSGSQALKLLLGSLGRVTRRLLNPAPPLSVFSNRSMPAFGIEFGGND